MVSGYEFNSLEEFADAFNFTREGERLGVREGQ